MGIACLRTPSSRSGSYWTCIRTDGRGGTLFAHVLRDGNEQRPRRSSAVSNGECLLSADDFLRVHPGALRVVSARCRHARHSPPPRVKEALWPTIAFEVIGPSF